MNNSGSGLGVDTPPLPEDRQARAGLYLHLPFCVVRCTYCDFYSLTGQDQLAPAYVDAMRREVAAFAASEGYRPSIASIYLGGGTPTHLPAGSVRGLLGAILEAFPVEPGAEITVEANPESASPEKLEEFHAAGATRVSIGVQSFRPERLALMGRPHGPDAARAAVRNARAAGFTNVSADLIYGVPGQDLEDWDRELSDALALETEHLSVYLLETDKPTPLARMVESGQLTEPDAATIAALYRRTEERIAAAGLVRYEVSNWCRPGRASRHNLGYWTDMPYIGFGASAHSYYGGVRWASSLSAQAYIDAVVRGEPTRVKLDNGEREIRVSEAIVTALRLAEGADLGAIGARYGLDLWSRYAEPIDDLVARGWAQRDAGRLRLTIDGILWSMDALAPFTGPIPRPARAARLAERGIQ